MDAELKVHINETGKYRSEYLTFAIQNLSKLDAYKDYIFNNINKNIASRVQKLQNLKSRINRIREILPKLNDCNSAMTIKSKKYYPDNKHHYYQYINLQDTPEAIKKLIDSNFNSNPNISKINIKRPLVDKGEKGTLGKIPKETLEESISSQILGNMQKKVKDLATELYELRFKNIGSSLTNELNDLVYEKTPYLETSFGFMNKKLIQKADTLWKVNKDEFDLKQNGNVINQNKDYKEPNFAKKSSKKLPYKLQEAPKSITTKAKIEKYVSKKVLLEKTKEKQEFNLPTSINLGRVVELKDDTANEETPIADENIYPEREDIDIDFDNQTDINNINLDYEYDLPVDIITRKNLENFKNDENTINPNPNNYNYKTANTSNINNAANNININVNDNINNVINTNTTANTINNYNNNYNQAPQNTGSSGKIVVVNGSGPGIPPPPPPPPPPPVVPVVPVQKAAKANTAAKKEADNEEEKPEPKKELSMAEQLAKVTLKKVPDAKKEEKPKPKLDGMDLLRQQILLRHRQITLHQKDQEEDNEEDEEEDEK
jgi:hypothetical protein